MEPERSGAFSGKREEIGERFLRLLQAIAESHSIPVGLTPRETVWTLNKARLDHYRPVVPPEQRRRVPLLLVYALLNHPYIFDLRPGASFVEYMLAQGFEVYLLDWGAPGPEDRRMRFDDYAADLLPRAMRKLLREAGVPQVSLLGYCMGGTLAALYAALHPEPVRNLVLLAAPLDFAARDSVLMQWLAPNSFPLDQIVDALGNIPAAWLLGGTKMLKPGENLLGSYVTLWKCLDDPEAVIHWQATHRWGHEQIPMAGETFRQYVREYLWENEFIRGAHRLGGHRVDPRSIAMPLLNIVAQYDYLVPPSQSLRLMDLVASCDRRLECVPGGHVGLMGGRNARSKVWPRIAEWLAPRSL